ncbi:MAG TPA: chromate resistance protein ChrB domain-containing protein [Burkholderiales bacterium]|nr:chromate resistance protein ChrB domain-containing protein [Burkholderiales bacterium]
MAQLPTEDPSARMRVLRKLESLGAGVLREGVYALPDTPANRKSLDELAAHVGREGGTAYALRVAATSQGQNDAFRRLFDRSAQYEALVKIVEGLRLGFGQSDPSALARVLLKQRRDFEAISALDFFPSPAKARAQQALADADQEIRKLYFSKAPTSIATGEKLHGRTWATRKPLRADRLASAWLVRRFIDPEAKMLWLEGAGEAPPGAISFGFQGAHFAPGDALVAYEEIMRQLQLGANQAIARIGAIVHYLEAGGAPVQEAAGVQTLLEGAVRRAQSDDELLAEAEKTFDLLYEAYFEPSPRQRGAATRS